MDSAPATSPDGAGVTGEAAFTARLGRRATPVVRTPFAVAARRGPGRLAGTVGAFGNRLGLSQTSRWTLDASVDTPAEATEHVRPPISYWPWDADEPAAADADVVAQRTPRPIVDDEPDDFVSSGDARLDALRRMLAPQKKATPGRRTPARADRPGAQPSAATRSQSRGRPVRRGLPQVLNRRGSQVRRAQPGDIARRLRPAAVDPKAVATRPAAGAVPGNLPAAAAQSRASVPPVPADGRARPEAPAQRRPADAIRRAAEPPTATRRPSATEPASPVAAPASPVDRRPLDLTAAARSSAQTPRANARAHGSPPPLVADGGAAPGGETGVADRVAPAPRPPAGPAASVHEPDHARPGATSTTPSAPTATGPIPRMSAVPADTGGPEPVTTVRRAPDPLAPTARPAGTSTVNPGAPDTGGPEPVTTMRRAPDPLAPTARPAGTSTVNAGAPDTAGGGLIDLAPGRAPTPLPDRATPGPNPRPAGTPNAPAAPRATDDTPLHAHRLDTGTPRPPAATAGTVSHAAGTGDAQAPPAIALAPRTPQAHSSMVPATASPAPTPPTSRVAAPGGGALAGDTVRRATATEPSRHEASAGTPQRTAAPQSERMSGSLAADQLGRAPRVTADQREARPAESRTTSPWPVQRSIDTSAPDVELAARTRPPTSPITAEPSASEVRHTRQFDASPAPPLAPRLRAVDDIGRSIPASSAPDTTPASRYRPTWQGDAAVRPDQPPIADRPAPIGRTTTSPERAPSSGPATPVARTMPAAGPAPARPTVETRPDDAAPPAADVAATPAALRTVADVPTGAPPLGRATSGPDGRAEEVRRAPVGDASVRPATSFAPDPRGDQPASSRPADRAQVAPVVPAALHGPDVAAPPAAPLPARTPSTATPAAPSAARQSAAATAATPSPVAAAPASPARPMHDRAAPSTVQRAVETAAPTGQALTDVAAPSHVPPSPPSHVPPSHVPASDVAAATSSTPAPPAVRRAALGRDADASHDPDAHIVPAATAGAGDRHAPDAPVRRFESVLRRAPAAPAPLPVQWRPLASAIAGERRVQVSTNAASRAALRAAGKRAATTGDVIHLAQPLRGPADAPLLAHELTHVASPSPAPRFFDDHRDSPEERRAEMIADVIRRSPVLPRAAARATTPDLPISGPTRARSFTETVRRTPSDHADHGATPSVTADELVRRLAGATDASSATATGVAGTIRRTPGAPAGRAGRFPTAPPAARQRQATPTAGVAAPPATPAIAGTLRRTVAGATRAAAGTATAGGADTIRRRQTTTTGPAVPATSDTDEHTQDSASGSTAADSPVGGSRGWPMMTNGIDSSTLRDLTDWIVEQVEERVIRDLERRGGRYRGEF